MSEASTHHKAELRASVANCLMGGDSITRKGDSWIRDLVEFDCGGYRFKFRQKPEVVNRNFDQYKGTFFETTEVTVADVAEDKVQEAKTAIERICWLLSFAGTCQVVPFEYEYPSGTGLTHTFAVSGVAQYFRPAFEISDGTQIKSFVEQTYNQYANLEQQRKLNVIVHYLNQAEASAQPMEIKLILVFVALESLKHTFAQSQGFHFVDGYFRNAKWKPKDKGNKYKFGTLVKMMLEKVGMTYDMTAAKKLRNDLIHSGLSVEPYNVQNEIYADVHDLIREYLLRLFGYRGRYSPYAFERRGVTAEI
ncbi:MAG: hypothetical protein Q7J20_02615 [Candidatus Nitrotoga sp.]|nr:hypothetical protein [Candidatus Nitrotoga sp.]